MYSTNGGMTTTESKEQPMAGPLSSRRGPNPTGRTTNHAGRNTMTLPHGDRPGQPAIRPGRTRPCPRCGAGAGEACTTTTGAEMERLTHRGRR